MGLSDERIQELVNYVGSPREFSTNLAVIERTEKAIRTAVAEAVAPWKVWERAWVFGGDAEWPGEKGTADPRQTVKELEGLVGEAVAAEREACAEVAENHGSLHWSIGIGREIAAAIRARGEEQ